jgi:hypothetical protein
VPLDWLHTCLDNHSQCALYETIVSNGISFPTRVLDVGDGSDPQVVRLVHGAGLVGRYVALSHCWGKVPVIKTTKESFVSFTKSIDPRTLTKTFRDAVTITRGLGIRYLWIDSLCIVQDDHEDWEREAAKMAQVYSQSLVTLAASGASDGSQGFLRASTSQPFIDIGYPSGRSHCLHTISVGQSLTRFQNLTKEPLNTRAWTLQERILSPRILHYCHDQLHWECRQAIKSEGGSPPYSAQLTQSEDESFHDGWLTKISSDLMPQPQNYPGMAASLEQKEEPTNHQDSWYGLVQEYTERGLSYDVDKLPALAGLANAYQRQHGGQYVAGLWSQDLVYGLLWYAKTDLPLRRPAGYRAPSWSWASTDGPVHFFTINAGRIPENWIEVEDLVYWIDLAGHDPFGQVKDGALTVTGSMREAKIKTIMEDTGFGDEDARLTSQMLFDEVSAIGSVTLDDITPDGPIFCLQIARSYLGYVAMTQNIALLLSPTEKENQYTRIGLAVFSETRDFTPERALRPSALLPRAEEWTNPWSRGGDKDSLADWFDHAPRIMITIV